MKILKKKEKIQNLRILIEELKEKLGQFNDRDLQSMHLLKMKEKQMYSLFFKTFFENKIIFFKKLNLIFKARMPGPIFSKKRPNTCKRSKTPKPSSKKKMPKLKRSQTKTAISISRWSLTKPMKPNWRKLMKMLKRVPILPKSLSATQMKLFQANIKVNLQRTIVPSRKHPRKQKVVACLLQEKRH